jgi:hypothetical protein
MDPILQIDDPIVINPVNPDTIRKREQREKKKLKDAGLLPTDYLAEAKKILDNDPN